MLVATMLPTYQSKLTLQLALKLNRKNLELRIFRIDHILTNIQYVQQGLLPFPTISYQTNPHHPEFPISYEALYIFINTEIFFPYFLRQSEKHTQLPSALYVKAFSHSSEVPIVDNLQYCPSCPLVPLPDIYRELPE